MNGTDWLEANKDLLVADCPIGRVTRSACARRVAILKNPATWIGGYNCFKCFSCKHSGLTAQSAEMADFRNWQFDSEGGAS